MRQNARKVLIAAPLLLLLTGCDEKIVNAGYNTLLGMGMAFTVLIIISLVISVLSILSKAPDARKKDDKDLRLKAVDNAVKQIEKQEQASAGAAAAGATAQGGQDGGFMLAIFAAAIAAYEADNGTGSHPVITGIAPAPGAAANAPLPDLSGWDGVYVRPLRKQNTVNWKRA